MNYYEHHIRDYDAATSHLSWDEDLAYTRLLRWYYRKEQPIPTDIKEACRQVRASSKSQKAAVEMVLNEFFILRDDGWHQETCDEALKKFLDGEPEREVKKANEDNRLKKHREERAKLFKALTDAGEHAAWNIPIQDLRELVERVAAAKNPKPVTLPATVPATPATATQAPDTNTQPPVLGKPNQEAAHRELTAGEPEDAQDALPEIQSTLTPEQAATLPIVIELRKLGVPVTAHNPLVIEWVRLGLTVDGVPEVIAFARTRGKDGPIHPNYLNTLMADALKPPKAKQRDTWWLSADSMNAKARDIGIPQARVGETTDAFKARIQAALNAKVAA